MTGMTMKNGFEKREVGINMKKGENPWEEGLRVACRPIGEINGHYTGEYKYIPIFSSHFLWDVSISKGPRRGLECTPQSTKKLAERLCQSGGVFWHKEFEEHTNMYKQTTTSATAAAHIPPRDMAALGGCVK
jgi:hypothetical protein